MSIPDFEKAEYSEPRVVEGEVVRSGGSSPLGADAALPLALVYGVVAAAAGSVGYALIWSFGFMISIVSIGVAWLVAKAMMTATGGRGGRAYQIAGVVLTYLAVSCGSVLQPLWRLHHEGVPLGILLNQVLLKYAVAGPFLELRGGLNGILGLVILFIGLRTAWRMGAGSPGFGQGGRTRRVDPFGLR